MTHGPCEVALYGREPFQGCLNGIPSPCLDVPLLPIALAILGNPGVFRTSVLSFLLGTPWGTPFSHLIPSMSGLVPGLTERSLHPVLGRVLHKWAALVPGAVVGLPRPMAHFVLFVIHLAATK